MPEFVEIARFTDKLDELVRFYEKLLAAKPEVQSSGMAIFMLGKTKLFLHQSYPPADGELLPENHLAFAVPDVEALCEQLAAEGYQIEVPGQEYYWGYSAYLRDPDGQLIELIREPAGI